MRVLQRAGTAAAVLLVFTTWTAAADLYVDDNTCPGVGNGSPGSPFCKIQDAICTLRTVPGGGTVYVNPGTYAEAIRMFKDVSVVSVGGPAVTTINATGKACMSSTCTVTAVAPCAVVYFPSASGGGGSTNADRLDGFTLTGGKGIKQTCSGTCNAQAGGGVFVLNSSPTITRNTITGNVLDPNNLTADVVFRGGGIYVGSSDTSPSRPVITLNTIEGNIADPAPGGNQNSPNFAAGAGIYVDENSSALIEANVIRNNRAGLASKANQWGGGGGIAIYSRGITANPNPPPPQAVVTRNHIYGNSAADYGGGVSVSFIYNEPHGPTRIENNLLEQNSAFDGGGVFLESTTAKVANNTITDNTAEGGAGISNEGNPADVASIGNNLVTYNVGATGPGGLYVGASLNPSLRYTDYFANTPVNVGGARTDAQVIGNNGNVSQNPLYVSRVAGSRNLRVLAGSPAIDHAENAAALGTADLDGIARVQDGDGNGSGVVDMGAFEFPGADFDGDGQPDLTDPDDDNDGVLDASDCAPLTRAVSGPAGEPGALRLSKSPGTERLRWNRGGQGHTSNVYRGDIVPGQPWSSALTCLTNEIPSVQFDDPTIPAVGRAFYYLVSARNSCGESRAGSTGSGSPVNPPIACSQANRDTDSEGLLDLGDNCAANSNANQADGDGDWVGDVCDNCASAINASQANADDDQRGDACDNCVLVVNDSQSDTDGDLVGDACDNCATTPNGTQTNTDLDAQGDACDPDDDNDTVLDAADNCPLVANPSQANNDLDTLGDLCDPDDDNDTVADLSDNCPLAANQGQSNLDGDSQGDVCDPCPQDALNDGDADGYCANLDNCPTTANADQLDQPDADGVGNVCDPDDDNDAVADAVDCAPLDATASAPPSEVGGLAIDRVGGTHLSWSSQGVGFRYDVAGGDLAALAATGNVSAATCLANDQATASWIDPRPDPVPGAGYYYLPRAQNACGGAGYGSASSGSPRVPAVDCP